MDMGNALSLSLLPPLPVSEEDADVAKPGAMGKGNALSLILLTALPVIEDASQPKPAPVEIPIDVELLSAAASVAVVTEGFRYGSLAASLLRLGVLTTSDCSSPVSPLFEL